MQNTLPMASTMHDICLLCCEALLCILYGTVALHENAPSLFPAYSNQV